MCVRVFFFHFPNVLENIFVFATNIIENQYFAYKQYIDREMQKYIYDPKVTAVSKLLDRLRANVVADVRILCGDLESVHSIFFVSEIKTVHFFSVASPCFALMSVLFVENVRSNEVPYLFTFCFFFLVFSLLIALYNHFTVNRMLPQSNQFVTLFWFHFSIQIALENIKMSWRNIISVLNFRFINSIINICLYHRFTIFCWTFQFGIPCLGARLKEQVRIWVWISA